MKNEFFESHETLGANDFSTQAILHEIEQARRGSAWNAVSLRRACDRASSMLDAAEQHQEQAPFEVLVSIGQEEDGNMVYVEDADHLYAVNPNEGVVLLGYVEEFAMSTDADEQVLYMMMTAPDMGYETCWVPLARAGESGFAMQVSGLPDITAYEDVDRMWAGTTRYSDAVDVQRYRDIADSVLYGESNTTPEQILEEIEDLVRSGPVDMDQLSTDMNMVIQEGVRQGEELYVDLSGEVECLDEQGEWCAEYLTDQEYRMVGVEFYTLSEEAGGFGALAYMQTDTGKLVRADMHESNFIIGVGDYVDDDISDDTFDN